MRIDKFFKAVNITKRRFIAKDMIVNKIVLINGNLVAKPAKNVEVGNIITINYLESVVQYEVLQIPTTKSTPKSLQDEYIKKV
jgi:ribosomal 50S subunit-recycling heat shock protein